MAGSVRVGWRRLAPGTLGLVFVLRGNQGEAKADDSARPRPDREYRSRFVAGRADAGVQSQRHPKVRSLHYCFRVSWRGAKIPEPGGVSLQACEPALLPAYVPRTFCPATSRLENRLQTWRCTPRSVGRGYAAICPSPWGGLSGAWGA
jgi:hypothetical protein